MGAKSIKFVPSEASVGGRTHGAGEQVTPGSEESESAPTARDCPSACRGGNATSRSASKQNRVFMTDGREKQREQAKRNILRTSTAERFERGPYYEVKVVPQPAAVKHQLTMVQRRERKPSPYLCAIPMRMLFQTKHEANRQPKIVLRLRGARSVIECRAHIVSVDP
jgi:hypothetical protein